jgi:capsular polysaccharide biosynthesis protein
MFEEIPKGEPASTAADALRVVWLRSYIIALVAIVITSSALGFSLAQTPTYEASILIVVGQKAPDEAVGPAVKNILDSEMLLGTVARAVDTRPVAQAVVEKLNLPEAEVQAVVQRVNVEVEPGTAFIAVSVRDNDPRRAQLVANAIGEAFSEQVSELNMSATPITARVWQQATLPETPISPRPLLNGGLALVIGILLGTIVAFMAEYLAGGETPGKK